MRRAAAGRRAVYRRVPLHRSSLGSALRPRGLVTEAVGVLSQAAILAREFALPAGHWHRGCLCGPAHRAAHSGRWCGRLRDDFERRPPHAGNAANVFVMTPEVQAEYVAARRRALEAIVAAKQQKAIEAQVVPPSPS